jgi:predicted DNA-binding transcriptional regulator YafY
LLQTVVDGLHVREHAIEADPIDGRSKVVAFTLDDTEATHRLLFGFGTSIEVLEPEALRGDLAERALRAARQYGR